MISKCSGKFTPVQVVVSCVNNSGECCVPRCWESRIAATAVYVDIEWLLVQLSDFSKGLKVLRYNGIRLFVM